MIYKISDISFDTDGMSVDLPKEMDVDVPEEYDNDNNRVDFILTHLSNATGFLVETFSIEM